MSKETIAFIEPVFHPPPGEILLTEFSVVDSASGHSS